MIDQPSTTDALVLAGGLNKIALFDGYVPGYKALLPVGGKPLISYTLDALKKAASIRRICIVGPAVEIRLAISNRNQYEFIDSGETLIENIQKGLKYFSDSSAVLVIPSDLPLVTPGAIRDFLMKSYALENIYKTVIFWSMVPEENFTESYAYVKKGFNRFRDVSVCHGNLLLITPSLVNNPGFISRMERIYAARKSSIKASLAIGPLVGLTYLIGVHLLRMLTISTFARVLSFRFKAGLVPVIINDPDIAIDIDEARDYHFVMEELNRRGLVFKS